MIVADPVKLVISLIIVGGALSAIERLFPAIANKPFWRKDSSLDLTYWFFTALVSKTLTKAAVFGAVVSVMFILGRHISSHAANGFPPVSNQPTPLIILEVLFIGDFISYFMHRAFHRGRLWKFHAIHHSSTQLDWLSSVRLHPINEMLQKAVQIVPFVVLGFPLKVLAAYVPFLTIYALFVHANVNWSFGPLRYIIATPRFHRWHHTSEEQGLDKNFAGLFPIFDIVFGTFYMPEESTPKVFGVCGTDAIPTSLWQQIIYPFKKQTQLASVPGSTKLSLEQSA
jgi:sterol desaturase/sphingolipid hydroxylase (fatty acid hydroxylase superfamily)